MTVEANRHPHYFTYKIRLSASMIPRSKANHSKWSR